VLNLQYRPRDQFGAPVTAFSTANHNIWGPRPTNLYNRIVAAMLISEQAPLPDSRRPAEDNG
jgi:hypothetical protein